MDIDEDDDFYAPDESAAAVKSPAELSGDPASKDNAPADDVDVDDELEEGEEEDEGGAVDADEDDDSDIDIITERKDGSKPVPPPQTRYNDIRNIPQRAGPADSGSTRKSVPGLGAAKEQKPAMPAYPTAVPTADKAAAAASSSKIDINGVPIYSPVGKPITKVNIDEDLADAEKPWRKPGTDITDYFNYGFDEFTWALYAAKQEALRGEYNQDIIAANSKKMMEDLSMMMMGGMPGMPGTPAGPSGSVPGAGAGGVAVPPGGIQGLDGMPPEMQAMLQQMMASGIDPSQMDPATMASMFAGMSQGVPGAQFGQGFGGQGQYAYDGSNMGGGAGGGGGGGRGGGRGRGGRRW